MDVAVTLMVALNLMATTAIFVFVAMSPNIECNPKKRKKVEPKADLTPAEEAEMLRLKNEAAKFTSPVVLA